MALSGCHELILVDDRPWDKPFQMLLNTPVGTVRHLEPLRKSVREIGQRIMPR
jgi:hypothetical protein